MGPSLEDEQVRRSAHGMITAYGREAGRICEHQIDKMRRRKDAAGERLWQGVLEHIRRLRPELQQQEVVDHLERKHGNPAPGA